MWPLLAIVTALVLTAPFVAAQDETASVVFEDQPTGGVMVLVENVTVPDGGFVAIHNQSLLEGKPFVSVIGVSEFLTNGSHENVMVELEHVVHNDTVLIAMPHRDTDNDRLYDFVETQGADDGPYTQNGDPVTDPANITATATIEFEDQTSVDNNTVLVKRVTMARGGFIAMHNASLLEGAVVSSVVGHSDFLAPGEHENVSVDLGMDINGTMLLIAMPHEDTDGDEVYEFVTSNGTVDGPYVFDGDAITDTANVTAAAVGDGDGFVGDDDDNDEAATPAPGIALVALATIAAAAWSRRR